MNTTKAVTHTLGPWVSVPRNRSCLASVPDDAWAIMHQSKNSDDPCDIGIIEGHENNESNARLIAAAPELLEALEATVNPLKDCYGWDRTNALVEQVESAISKAKEGK